MLEGGFLDYFAVSYGEHFLGWEVEGGLVGVVVVVVGGGGVVFGG